MEEIPEFIRNITGWIVLLLIVASIWLMVRGLRSGKVRIPTNWRMSTKEDAAGHHGSVDSHHADSHGSHEGDHGSGHDHHKKRPLWQLILIWIGVLSVLICFAWFLAIPFFKSHGVGQIPGALKSLRFEYSQTHGSTEIKYSSSTSEAAAVYVRKSFTAPAQSGNWSSWINVPSGFRLMSCEANDDLTCADTESDVTKVAYAYECMTLDGSVGSCEHYVAIRVRSKDETTRKLAYWFEPYSG